MENIEEYWKQIPEYQNFIEIKNILDSLNVENISEEAQNNLIDFFQFQLIENPTPTWNLLHSLYDNIDDKKNLENSRILYEIAIDALKCVIVYEHLDEDVTVGILDQIFTSYLLSEKSPNLLQNHISHHPHHQLILRSEDLSEICDLVTNELFIIQPSIRSCLKILKMSLNLKGNEIFSDKSWWSEIDETCEIFVSQKSALNVAYLELKRRKNILKFLHDKEVQVTEQIFTSNEILGKIVECGIKTSIENYEELKNLLSINEMLLCLQNSEIKINSEMNFLNELTVNQLYQNLLQSTEPSKEFINNHVTDIRKILKFIDDGEIILKIFKKISDIIKLKNNNRNESSSNFICHQRSFKAILDSMRMFLTSFDQTDIYKSCSNETKLQFDETLKLLDNALWKYDIIASKNMENEYYACISNLISEKFQLDSTDDEVTIKRKKSFKRKVRKRKKSVIEIQKNGSNSDDYDSLQSSTSTEEKSDFVIREDNIISKMSMKPNELIKFCLSKNDHLSVEKVIEKFNLQNTRFARQAKFVMNFKNTRLELMKISKEYPSNDETASHSNINEIKNLTEKGLIKEKFFHVIRNFTSKNRLKIYEDRDDKYQLEMTLNSAAIINMFISIPCTFELAHDFFNFIMTNFKLNRTESEYKKFLIKFMEIMTICKNHDIDTNIVEILKTQTFDLNPEKFKREIKLRKSLIEIWNRKNLTDKEKIQNSVKILEQLECKENESKNAVNYARNVRRILKLITCEKLSFDDIMKLNAHNLIGKILFELQYNPEMIEKLVNHSHIDLIAVMCGSQVINKHNDDDKLLTLFHLKEFSGCSDIEIDLETKENFKNLNLNKLDDLYNLKNKNFFEVKEFINLSCLYDGNRILTVLNYDHIDIRLLLKRLQEITKPKDKMKILDSISQKQWLKNKTRFDEIYDSYVEIVVNTTKDITTKMENIAKIKDIRKFYELLMKHIGEIDAEYFAEKLLMRCLNDDESDKLDLDQKQNVKTWLEKLKIFSRIVKSIDQKLGKMSWNDLRKTSEDNPNIIANHLLNITPNFQLCAEFFKISNINLKSEEFQNIITTCLNNENYNNQLDEIFYALDCLPLYEISELLITSLQAIKNLTSLTKVIEFLQPNIKNSTDIQQYRYQKFKITTKMFQNLENYENFWHLSGQPLLIIEQLLMNLQLNLVKILIEEVRKILNKNDYCFTCDKSGSEMYQVREVIICDLDSLHEDLIITNECFDLMFKCYATKALDFELIDVPSSNETSTIESIHSVFHMPKEIPSKSEWTPDSDAKICMCCRKQKFSLFSRRHHCRRCGRVVCDDCSKHRVQLPEMYRDLCVRICLDCHRKLLTNEDENSIESNSEYSFKDKDNLWRLSGVDATDQMIRDEFSYDESPSISLCLDIMDFHTPNDEIAKFLVFHCYRLELLLRPIRGRINPEVDIILVAKMMKSLSLAAKVHGNHGEANLIIDHADVIMKVVENGCEYIVPQIPMEKINSVTMRSIINDLIKAENWTMALELSVKFDTSGKIGVFSAWGVSAIKNGKYKLAREKISLAIQQVQGSSIESNERFLSMLTSNEKIDDFNFNYRRSNHGSPLLTEILEALELTASKRKPFQHDELIEESIGIEIEPNIDVIVKNEKTNDEWETNDVIESPYFEESMYYLIKYGGDADILQFLMRNNLIPSALRFVQSQKIQSELFIQYVFVPLMRVDKMESLIKYLRKLDPRFIEWKTYLIHTCKYLEKKKAFNSLYQMQTNVGDRIRAALTCIDFYCDGVKNYTELHSKASHLNEAKSHLLTELEKVEWMSKEVLEKSGKDELILKWDLKTINTTINIISLQLEIAKYLADCESNNLKTTQLMKKIFNEKQEVRTLFGKSNERTQVAILVLICGKSIETGYGISYRIIQECSLKASRIYSTSTKFLAKTLERLMDIEKLIESIKANSSNEESDMIKLCDDLIAMAIEIAHEQHQNEAKTQIDHLIKLITSDDMKIECYINSNQLKTAYMKSAAMNNLDYVHKIMSKAIETRQENIRRLCEKKLQASSDSMSQCSKSDT